MIAAGVALGGCVPWLDGPIARLRPDRALAPGAPFPGSPGLAGTPGATATPVATGTPGTAAAPHARGPTSPFDKPVPCGGGRLPSRLESIPSAAIEIRRLVFLGLRRPLPPRRFALVTGAGPGPLFLVPLTVPVVVPPFTHAVIAVPPDEREVAGLDSGPDAVDDAFPSDAHRAVACTTGPAQRTFEISFVIAGARCVPISVTSRGRTETEQVRFGVRRCTR